MNVRLFLFCLIVFTSFGQDYWEVRDSIKGAPRAGMATFVLGNRGYAVGGIKVDGSTRKCTPIRNHRMIGTMNFP